ncbi:hypothetical protein [Mycoplasmopsis anatis]|uniref:hypothetical protein n=1 Tax=Mycoplasmopsis anatis TaxID=171279 RepID=UPI0010051508|nr:hypothetical protein [Mycoplasmopsis anatis]VEU73704.1 Uncharacterised protein [Mycoplasmopsis anatis]
MNIKKIETKLNNLDKIYKIVESNKNVTLINILKLSKSINNYFERSRYSKELIKTIQNKYNVTHEFLKASTFSSLFKGKNHFQQFEFILQKLKNLILTHIKNMRFR